MSFRRQRNASALTSKDKQLIAQLIVLLAKIIGSSVKDKLIRALMVGVIASVGSYTAIENGALDDSTPEEAAPIQAVAKPTELTIQAAQAVKEAVINSIP